jgi:ankyrin repeat protein
MKDDYNKFTALHLASFKGHEEIVKLLLNTFYGEERDKLIEYVVKKEAYKNRTALHLASLGGHVRIVELLLNTFMKKKKTN